MAEGTYPTSGGGGGGTSVFAPITRSWRRLSPSLVPVLAVVTALIVTVPFMVITRGGGNLNEGLRIAGTAYAALLEGAVGISINSEFNPDDVAIAQSLIESEAFTRRDLLTLSRQAQDITDVGRANIDRYTAVLARYDDSEILTDDEAINALGERVGDMTIIGTGRLEEVGPLLAALEEAPRAALTSLAREIAVEGVMTEEFRAAIVELSPEADAFSDNALADGFALLNQYGYVRLARVYEQYLVLQQLDLEPNDGDAQIFREIYDQASTSATGIVRVRELAIVEEQLVAAGITDIPRLSDELRLISNLYSAEILTDNDVTTALNEQLIPASESQLVVRRPGNRVLVHPGVDETSGIIYTTRITPDAPSENVPETVYLRVGGQVLLFFPANLETMLTRSIPFVIAGLAVALGFKAGLFNIGAEGQLYMGAILAAWVGFSAPFTSLPGVLHIFLVVIVGIMGGALWGSIPGILKAYTGAHEVINTIMLNFVAIRLVDWLIKSTNPVILLDTTASTPRTPFIAPQAMLPTFDNIATAIFIAAGALTFAFMLWGKREHLPQNPRYAIRPVIFGLLVAVGGMFLSWISVRGNLHIGLVIMALTVWFVDWFLDRTTLGFELRTVGANQNAARYAGMNVKLNIILAMTMSGALAGLAGTIEIAGVQHNMQPAFFAGLGFDSIAVALLARNNPRNMIPAGVLWGALLAGAGLMQVRADISIDLVKIIQALIIMFIAADAIIRSAWFIPKATAEEKAAATFSKGWGS